MWGTCDQSLFISNQRKKNWSLSDGTKQKVRKKYERMQLVEKLAEAIAPGQSDELISQVLHNEDEDAEEESVPEDLIVPLKMFKESDVLGQILVLAVINHSKYI